MLKNLIRTFVAVIGAALGYGASIIVMNSVMDILHRPDFLTPFQRFAVSIATAIIIGFIFFLLAPKLLKQSEKIAAGLGRDLQNVSAGTLVAGAIGLLFGLLIATLLAQLLRIIPNRYVYSVVVVITYLVLCYLGAVTASMKGKDIISGLFSRVAKSEQPKTQQQKKHSDIPKIFDTSVIIDGRISEIMKTGFLEGQIVIPDFVLVELRHIADSADSLKRTRGRRGLDILNMIRDEYGVEIYNTDSDKELKEIPEVDVKLLKLAQLINGDVVTNDYNLNKVAGINGVRVLNINELANCLKPVVIPGEEMQVALIKEGKTSGQAIGYLDDGTMIVCENGREKIGETTTIKVTSVLQTAAGRMIFGRLEGAGI